MSATAVFALPTAWRPAPGDDQADGSVAVEYTDLTDGLTALAGICGTDLPVVLLAAHVKVLSMLGEADADDRHTEVARGTVTHHVPVIRTAATWQELVLRTAKTTRPGAPSADERAPGERVLFTGTAGTDADEVGDRLGGSGEVGCVTASRQVRGAVSVDGSATDADEVGDRLSGSGEVGCVTASRQVRGAVSVDGSATDADEVGDRLSGSGEVGCVTASRQVRGAVSNCGSAAGRDQPPPPRGFTTTALPAERPAYGLEVVAAEGQLTLTTAPGAIAPRYRETLGAMYREVLEAMAAGPDGDALAARLAPRDRRSVLDDWSTGATVDRDPATVAGLIEEQAARTPDAPAVRVAGIEVTYRELDERANRIARRLTALGARPDALVGVCLRRTADLLPALLGVWKSGAGYLPLDPAMPAERLQHMIAAAGCELVVSESVHLPALGPLTTGDLVLLDRERESIDALSAAPLDSTAANPRSLAYVIYTSGSTGNPKGVMVEHAGLANYLRWTAEAYAARGTGGAPVFSSISFDLQMPSLFAPLLTGQPVHLLPDPLDTADLGDELVGGAPYSFIKMTPGHLDLLSYDLTPEEIHGLAGLVIAAGDAFTSELARRWIEFAGPGGTPVATEYGPTEITIGNSGETLTEPPATELIPLGAPIPNTTMYVLTDRLEPVPVGVPGEVCIGGAGVARGYLDRPGLTAERFLPDPFGAPGARLYRTGDRARWRADGSLEFLGRVDNQVKIRGFRVELGEIQARLREHSQVADAVVIAVGTPRSRSLAAYVIPVTGQQADVSELRDHLAAVLPGYMIPAHFVAIDQVPLTTNGKVDTRALQSLL
ncbi:amino acid adenylation domain-containing protein [Streptomyces sp. NPDC020898]|uniref:amino acid adenylation domain-containing protein n=1 Tax=Streptomyces sp. NPDC020898 TaxID=3365101 RepID=UPI00379B494F